MVGLAHDALLCLILPHPLQLGYLWCAEFGFHPAAEFHLTDSACFLDNSGQCMVPVPVSSNTFSCLDIFSSLQNLYIALNKNNTPNTTQLCRPLLSTVERKTLCFALGQELQNKKRQLEQQLREKDKQLQEKDKLLEEKTKQLQEQTLPESSAPIRRRNSMDCIPPRSE